MMLSPAAPALTHQPFSRLRPRSIGGIVDQAFRVYRRHFLEFLAIVAVFYVPAHLLSVSTGWALEEANGYSGIFVITALLNYLEGFLAYFSQAAVVVAVMTVLQGQATSLRHAYREVFTRAGDVLGLMGLQLFIWVGAFVLVGLGPIVALLGASQTSIEATSEVSAACGMPVYLLYLIVYVRLQFALPSLMVEDLGPRRALTRSWELMRDYWWRTFGLLILLGLIALAVSIGPTALILGFVYGLEVDDLTSQILLTFVTVSTTLLVAPLQLIAVALYYVDLRVRKESLDLEMAIAERYGQPEATAEGGLPYRSVPGAPDGGAGRVELYSGYEEPKDLKLPEEYTARMKSDWVRRVKATPRGTRSTRARRGPGTFPRDEPPMESGEDPS